MPIGSRNSSLSSSPGVTGSMLRMCGLLLVGQNSYVSLSGSSSDTVLPSRASISPCASALTTQFLCGSLIVLKPLNNSYTAPTAGKQNRTMGILRSANYLSGVDLQV